ncbi:hypothetical protein CerSpe_164710 [Prunus speciosa]
MIDHRCEPIDRYLREDNLKVCFVFLVQKYKTDDLKLSVEQEASEGLKEPRKVLYEDKDLVSAVSYSFKENHYANESGNV